MESEQSALDEEAKKLYIIAKGVAARGEPYVGGNRFNGISGDGQKYSIDNNFWNCDHRWVSIYGPNFGVSVSHDRDDYPYKERSGFSIRVWRGSKPENLTEILEGLQPDKKQLAQFRSAGVAPRAGSFTLSAGYYDEAEEFKRALGGAVIGTMLLGPFGMVIGAVLARRSYQDRFK